MKYKASILAVTLFIMSIILTIALAVSLAAVKQRNASLGSGKSNLAFQNADTGVEEVMNKLARYPGLTIGSLDTANWICTNLSNNHANLTSSSKGYSVELKGFSDSDIVRCATTLASSIASIKSTGIGANQESRAIEAAVAMGPSQKARGYRAAAMNIPAGGVRIPIDTESYDSSNILDTSTGRITPTMPGYYQVDGQVNTALLGRTFIFILKNGQEVARGTDVYSTAAMEVCGKVSDVIYLNGTSDYIELGVYVNTASSLSAASGRFWKNYLSIVGPF